MQYHQAQIQDADKHSQWKKRKYLKACLGGGLAVAVLLGLALLARPALQSVWQEDPDAHFASCAFVAGGCTDASTCGLRAYCGQGNNKDCRIYDCGRTYGVYVRDAQERISFSVADKPEEEAVAAVREACSGTLRILEEGCTEGKLEMHLALHTKGACEIERMAVFLEGVGEASATFAQLEDGTFAIQADQCGKVVKIVPVATGGVGLELGEEKE